MKKRNFPLLITAIGGGCLLLNALGENKTKVVKVANAYNEETCVNADDEYLQEDKNLDFAYSNMNFYTGDESYEDAKKADINAIKRSEYDIVSCNGEEYTRITDEYGNCYGISEEKERLKWGIFFGTGLHLDIHTYCSVYYRIIAETPIDRSKRPNVGETYNVGLSKSESFATKISEDISLGTGFGGFAKAGISYHHDKNWSVDSTFGLSSRFAITNSFANSSTMAYYGITDYYVEYLIVTFSHFVEDTKFLGVLGFGAPNISLRMNLAAHVRRDLLYTNVYCLDGGKY